MKLSIVATLYNSEEYLKEFYLRATSVAKKIADDNYEILFVNDGSPDNSLDQALAIAEYDSKIVLIDLSRNFGHHKAMMTGLMYSRGELVFLIDSDLEEEPEWLLQFNHQMNKHKCDVISGFKFEEKAAFLNVGVVSCFIFYSICLVDSSCQIILSLHV